MIPPSIQWRAAPQDQLLWRAWDDEFLVYHVPSGDTHLLNPLAADVLRRLQQAPAREADLVGHLAGPDQADRTTALTEHVRELLRVFDESGLIEPVGHAE